MTVTEMPRQRLLAPAKLNLWLQITGVQRDDGRHELRSHFAPLALADTLWVEPADDFSISVHGPFAAGVPTDRRNLVWQAFQRFSHAFGSQRPLTIQIDKQIPHGAGLGGGSSDAGPLLRHLAGLADVPIKTVMQWSLCLGADIPAAVKPHSGLVEGVGEVLGPALPLPDRDVLLVKPPHNCPTGAVFQAWRDLRPAPSDGGNDLAAAAIHICPAIGTVLDILRAHVDANAQMTGSGSACFALVPKGWQMDAALGQALAPYWVCQTSFK